MPSHRHNDEFRDRLSRHMRENADILALLADEEPSPTVAVTREEILAVLHEADGYLSLIGYRYREALARQDGDAGYELAVEMQRASSGCRSLAKRIEEHGLA